MSADDSLPTLKILLLGPSGAGKSALLIRYCDDLFDDESSTATIGVDFKIKKLSVRGRPYRLNLLDTAGQERFRSLSSSYYRGAHGAIFVYDISSRESFLSIDRWFEEAKMHAAPGMVTYLVGSKLDRENKSRAVTREEGQALAHTKDAAGFCELSAKTKENVKQPFTELVATIVSRPDLLESRTAQNDQAGNGLINMTRDIGAKTWNSCSC